jgi:hypothetical protein
MTKAGRPRKSPFQRRDDSIEVRLAKGEKQAFRDAAELAGIPLSAWVRERLRHAAMRELEPAARPIEFLRHLRKGWRRVG